jgi:hypothetical protein
VHVGDSGTSGLLGAAGELWMTAGLAVWFVCGGWGMTFCCARDCDVRSTVKTCCQQAVHKTVVWLMRRPCRKFFWAVGRLFGFSSGRTARIVTGTSAGLSGSSSGVTARIVTGLDAESAL